ncbi:MAG TPA: ATP-binding protein [Gemmataceae bacterium]|nr:ATP-binding protein [Gemmataceae bacterium]
MTTAETDPQNLRVLVLTPPEPDATLIRTVLGEARLAASFCDNLEELCRQVEVGAGAALLAEESLQPGGVQSLVELLGRQPPWSDFPLLIFFDGGGESLSTALRMLDILEPFGNVTVLERPVRLMTLVSALRAALHARSRQYQVRRLLGELEEAVRRRDSFLVQLAHELRNPLGTIRNATHNLERIDLPEEVGAHQRTVIGRQTSHLARVIDDLLDASRVTSGKIQLQRQAVDLREVVAHALREQDTAARAQRQRLSFTAGPERFRVEGDPRRLGQVVANLVHNAVSYTPEGGDIRVSLTREGAEVVLRVADDGVGIAPEQLPHVFDLFAVMERLPDRPTGGLGIGLPLVRALVEMHGGKVEAHSAGRGRGSEFVVRLPPNAASEPAPRGTAGAARGGRRVLVVEDNPDGRDTLRMMLAMWGHHVEVAADGRQGVEQALALRPEVALVDIGLPQLDGYEVARRVRAALGRDIFLIALTGFGQPHDCRRAFEAGFDAHLVKPADPQELHDLLEQVAAP